MTTSSRHNLTLTDELRAFPRHGDGRETPSRHWAVRARTKIGLKNLTYNFQRFLGLTVAVREQTV